MEETIRKIDLALKKRGNTQSDLADYLHVSRQTLSKIMTGKRKLQLDELIKIAEFLELPLMDIIDGQDSRKSRYSTLIDAYNAGTLSLADLYSQMHSQYNYLLYMGANEKELYAYSQYIEQLERKILEDYMRKEGYIYRTTEDPFSLGNWTRVR